MNLNNVVYEKCLEDVEFVNDHIKWRMENAYDLKIKYKLNYNLV